MLIPYDFGLVANALHLTNRGRQLSLMKTKQVVVPIGEADNTDSEMAAET